MNFVAPSSLMVCTRPDHFFGPKIERAHCAGATRRHSPHRSQAIVSVRLMAKMIERSRLQLLCAYRTRVHFLAIKLPFRIKKKSNYRRFILTLLNHLPFLFFMNSF